MFSISALESADMATEPKSRRALKDLGGEANVKDARKEALQKLVMKRQAKEERRKQRESSGDEWVNPKNHDEDAAVRSSNSQRKPAAQDLEPFHPNKNNGEEYETSGLESAGDNDSQSRDKGSEASMTGAASSASGDDDSKDESFHPEVPSPVALESERRARGQNAENVPANAKGEASQPVRKSRHKVPSERPSRPSGGSNCSSGMAEKLRQMRDKPAHDDDDDDSAASSFESAEIDFNKSLGEAEEEEEGSGGAKQGDLEAQSAPKTAPSEQDLILGGGRFVLPAHLNKGLYEHQRFGITWMFSLHEKMTGGILGDDMGLGKTRQVASFLAGLFRTKSIKRVLLILPVTLFDQWELEFSCVDLGNESVRLDSSVHKNLREYNTRQVVTEGGILMTTYDMVKHIEPGMTKWDYVIMDEGHLAKSPTTQRFKNIKALNYRHCLILTGTPIQNNLKELWALFDLCCPNLLGSYKEFKQRFEKPIETGNDRIATTRQKRDGNAAAQALRDKIQPFFLRRLKRDIFPSALDDDLAEMTLNDEGPPRLRRKNDLIIWLEPTNRQTQMYEGFLQSEIVRNALNESKHVLAAITVLNKICNHPGLLNENSLSSIKDGIEDFLDDAGSDIDVAASLTSLKRFIENPSIMQDPKASCKIRFVDTLLEKLVDEGHRVLIFAQTKMMLDMVQSFLQKKHINFYRMDGETRTDQRSRLIDQFQASRRVPVFLLTSKVGGLGITLTAADRVIILDPAWNPSIDNQSVDRAYRIGQKRDVVVYRLVTAGTIEEKMYRRQVFKDSLMQSATNNSQGNMIRYFTHSEIHDLLSMPQRGFKVSETAELLSAQHEQQIQLKPEVEQHLEKVSSFRNVVGISHHDLLFSKEAPALPEIDISSMKQPGEPQPLGRHSSSGSGMRRVQPAAAAGGVWQGGAGGGILAGAQAAMHSIPSAAGGASYESRRAEEELKRAQAAESSIASHILRLENLMSNKGLQLVDGGEKIRKQLEGLRQDLASAQQHTQLIKEQQEMRVAGAAAVSSNVATTTAAANDLSLDLSNLKM